MAARLRRSAAATVQESGNYGLSTILSSKKTYIDPRDLPAVDRAMLPRILACLGPYRKQAALVGGAVLLSALLGALPPLFIKALVDHLDAVAHHGAVGSIAYLVLLCAGMIVGPLLASLLGVGQKYLAAWIGEHVMLDLRLRLFEHLQR